MMITSEEKYIQFNSLAVTRGQWPFLRDNLHNYTTVYSLENSPRISNDLLIYLVYNSNNRSFYDLNVMHLTMLI